MKESKSSRDSPLEGMLLFHSETGTEGGYWAFQDRNYITKDPCSYGAWPESQVFDTLDPQREGRVGESVILLKEGRELPLPDPLNQDPDYIISSLFRGEHMGDRDADQRLMERYNFRIIYDCEHWDLKWGKGNWSYENAEETTAISPDGQRYMGGGTPTTDPHRPYGVSKGEVTRSWVQWKDGVGEERTSDTLLQESWGYGGLHTLNSGDYLTILDPLDSHVLWKGLIQLKPHPLFTETASGMWIHSDQEGVDRDKWANWFFKELPALLLPKRNS
jgi:hypothetical protein